MIVSGLLGDIALDKPACRLKIEHEDLGLKQRCLHPLPFAGLGALDQRKKYSLRQKNSRGQVRDRNADPHRTAARLAGDRHQPAHPLRDLVDPGARCIRPVLPEAGNTAIDDARIDLRYRVVVDPKPMLDVRTIVLDHDIRGFGQLQEDCAPLIALEIERHGALVAVEVLVVGTVAAGADRIALRAAGRLDLDDVGAPVG